MGIWDNISDNIPGFGGSSDASSNGAASSGDANASDPDASGAEPPRNGAPRNGTSAENASARTASEEASEEAQAARTKEGARSIMSMRYTFTTKQEPDADRPFAHGYVDGAEDVEKTPFEQFVRIQAEVERINEELKRLEAREQELKTTREERVDLEANVERDRVRLEAHERDTAEAEQTYNEVAVAHPSAQEAAHEAGPSEKEAPPARADDTPPKRGSFLYGALYTTAGIVFVGGEIIMSYEVVAKGLRLPPGWESWLFALGLAFLAVLMKPAYDRLVEKPYWKGNRRAFRWAVVISVGLTVITLAVLGFFRSEAFLIGREIAGIDGEIAMLETQEGVGGQAEELQSQRTEVIESRTNGAMRYLTMAAFVLSGVLFAVGGAVTLGIGLGHLRVWSHRKQIREEVDHLKSDRDQQRDKLDEHRIRLRGREEKLSHMPAMDVLNEQLRRVAERQEELRAARSAAIGNRGVEAYTSGYDLAQQSKASFQVAPASRPSANGMNGESNGSNGSNSSRASDTDDESSHRRPFLRIRDEISSKTFKTNSSQQ